MRFPFASPVQGPIRVTKNLVGLDLATGVDNNKKFISPELKTKNLPSLAGYLDLALCQNTILVPDGQVKMFNKMIIKHMGSCGQFVLFPNFPKEIQCEIFKHCSALQPRRISFIEMEDEKGDHWMQTIGARRPAIFAASKLALTDAIARKIYTPMFATNGGLRGVYFSVGTDWAQLGTVPSRNYPWLDLAREMVNKVDLASITVLNMSWFDVDEFNVWMALNLAAFPNLKTLHVTASLFDAGRAEPGVYTIWFKEVYGHRNAFMQFCNNPDGNQVELGEALKTFDSYICSTLEKDRIEEFNTKMNICLNRMPAFPLEVAFILHYLPVPGYPLAAIQPAATYA